MMSPHDRTLTAFIHLDPDDLMDLFPLATERLQWVFVAHHRRDDRTVAVEVSAVVGGKPEAEISFEPFAQGWTAVRVRASEAFDPTGVECNRFLQSLLVLSNQVRERVRLAPDVRPRAQP